MTDKTFEECFTWLEKFHAKRGQITETARSQWWEKFKDEDEDIFCHAMLIAGERMVPGHFPKIEQFQKFVTLARETLWAKKKEAEPKRPLSRPTFAPDYRNVSRGRLWIRGIIDILDGKQTPDQLIAAMGPAPSDHAALPPGDREL